jgi:hypothetical protein
MVKQKIVFDELQLTQFTLLERFLLMFKKAQVVKDYGFGDKSCTIKFKQMFGKFYLIDCKFN